MKTNMYRLALGLLLLVSITGCFKNEPRKETLKAAGSWKLEEVVITKFLSTGEEISSETQTEAGFLMLSFGDDFMYQNYYSYSLKSDLLANSKIYSMFQIGNVWNLSVNAKSFNLGMEDASTQFVELVGSLTINRLTRNKMELQMVQLDPSTDQIVHSEVWKLKSATH